MLYMDYHVHCQNSPDSSEPLEEICKGAVDAGIKEIMITDHYEMFTDDFGRKAADNEPFYRKKKRLFGQDISVDRTDDDFISHMIDKKYI